MVFFSGGSHVGPSGSDCGGGWGAAAEMPPHSFCKTESSELESDTTDTDTESDTSDSCSTQVQHSGSSCEEEVEACRCAHSIAENKHFKLLVTALIVLNAVGAAVQADGAREESTTVWSFVNLFFVVVFVFEILVRILADGLSGFFCDKEESFWNVFDFVVVGGSILEIVLEEVPAPMLVLRSLRILRVLRIVPVFYRFKKLRMLVRGLLESMKIVFWVFVLCFLMIFLCAIVCTTIIGQDKEAFKGDEEEDIQKYWGSVVRSMFTLFQFLTMDDWNKVYQQVIAKKPAMELFFFVYIFFGAFVIMSLLTGVMADHMNDVRRLEEEDERRQKMREREHTEMVAKSADTDHDGRLNTTEFKQVIAHHSLISDLNSAGMNLRESEARELFEWFDVDGDGFVNQEELYHGIKHLFEGISGLQMYKLKIAIKRAKLITEQRVARSEPLVARRKSPSQQEQRRLVDLTGGVMQLEGRMEQFETQVRSFMKKLGWTSAAGDESPLDISPTLS